MSVAAASRSETPSRGLGVAALVAATIAAAAGGAALGTVLGGDDPAPSPPAKAQPRIGLKSGVARLPMPAGWKPLYRLSSLPGLEQATAVRGTHGEVALDIRPPEAASLLPAALAATQPGELLPPPRPVRLGTRTVWRYDLAGARPDRRVVALALPTTGGVVTIACGSAAAAAASPRECEGAMQSLQLDGASALAPAPETAAAILLPRTAALLNRRRQLERRRLARTRSPAARSAAAQRLAKAYADAARALLPVAAGDAARLTTALDALAQRHRVLAAASRERRAAAAGRASAAIKLQEQRLGALLAAVTEPAGR